MPAISPKGGASRCQLMTEPGGYSVTSTSAFGLVSLENHRLNINCLKDFQQLLFFLFAKKVCEIGNPAAQSDLVEIRNSASHNPLSKG
jgi:hypothetical protein